MTESPKRTAGSFDSHPIAVDRQHHLLLEGDAALAQALDLGKRFRCHRSQMQQPLDDMAITMDQILEARIGLAQLLDGLGVLGKAGLGVVDHACSPPPDSSE